MANTQISKLFATTHPVLLAYTKSLFHPRAFRNQPADTAKYDSGILLRPDHPDMPALRQLFVEVATQRWPGRALNTLAFPLKVGDQVADNAKAKAKDAEYARGYFVIQARSKFPPRLSAVVNGQLIVFEDDAQRASAAPYFYDGVQAYVQINFFTYDGVGANPDGVSAGLNVINSLNQGDRLKLGSVTSNPTEIFSGLAGHISMVDPTKRGDGGVPAPGAPDSGLPF